MSIGLILVDPKGAVVWLNRAAEQLLGLPASECIGRNFKQLSLDPQLAAFWADAVCREGGCMSNVSVRYPRDLNLKLNATQCIDADGELIGRALLFCDVTSEYHVKVELTREIANRLLELKPVAGGPPSEVSSLTQQELRMLRLVGGGMSNLAIAKELHIAASTVRSHLKSIHRKLRLRTRAAVVSFAVRNGLA